MKLQQINNNVTEILQHNVKVNEIKSKVKYDKRIKDKNELNVLLTVHHSTSVWRNQRDALSIQFIKNQGPPHVSSFACSSLSGAAQTALGIWRACYVSWLHQDDTAN
jgi:hypothetical protein